MSISLEDTYVEVILPVPVEHGFIYRIDKTTQGIQDITIGQRVLVPFGSRMLTGIIRKTGIEKPNYETRVVKEVLDRVPCISIELFKLLEWASDYYFHPIGDVFKQFIPHKDIGLEANKFYKISSYNIDLNDFSSKEKELIAYLLNKKVLSAKTLAKRFNKDIINRLYKTGILEVIFKTPVKRSTDSGKDQTNTYKDINEIDSITPTEEQKEVIDELTNHMKTNTFLAALIMGVTGSGKTEIYIRLIENAIAQGKNAIVLVPEIALTPQLVNRFIKRFGSMVGVVHSKIKSSLIKDTYQRILENKVRIVIGVRAGIFVPLKHVGIIVVDEEHEHTYKQEDGFRYHARDVAIMRGKLEHALVVLGSATPSIESYYNAQKGKYKFYMLEHRVHNLPMPKIYVIDLKREHPHKIGNEILTKPVVDALLETFSKNKQAIIMLNKRGYSASIVCADCGHVEKCPQCDISLTYHKQFQRLICHYCGFSEPVFNKCPVCGSPNIKPIGIGTQKLEEEIKRIFNNINMIRMDKDTTTKIGSHERFINMFSAGRILVLLGTQMVAKGLDFPDVELVCLPLIDVGLNIPDFRSGERIFDIIMQSAGRAGRATPGARVFIQTYNPDYYPVKYAVEYNTELFYKTELNYRKDLFYPPFSRMALIIFKHRKLESLKHAMDIVTKELNRIDKDIKVSGPVPAPVGKIKGVYVYHVLLKSTKIQPLIRTLKFFNKIFKTLIPEISFTIDMDPQHFI